MEVIDDAIATQEEFDIPVNMHAKKPSLKLDDPVKEALREACFKDSFTYSHK